MTMASGSANHAAIRIRFSSRTMRVARSVQVRIVCKSLYANATGTTVRGLARRTYKRRRMIAAARVQTYFTCKRNHIIKRFK